MNVRIVKYHPATAKKAAFCDRPIEREVSGRTVEQVRDRVTKLLESMNLSMRSMNIGVDGVVHVVVWHKKQPLDAKMMPGWRWRRPGNQSPGP